MTASCLRSSWGRCLRATKRSAMRRWRAPSCRRDSSNCSKAGTRRRFMANVLLGVTGSVAAIYTRELFDELSAAGHTIKVVATRSSLYFFDPASLDSSQPKRNRDRVILDEDE